MIEECTTCEGELEINDGDFENPDTRPCHCTVDNDDDYDNEKQNNA